MKKILEKMKKVPLFVLIAIPAMIISWISGIIVFLVRKNKKKSKTKT